MDRFLSPAFEALERGRVLAVDRQYPPSSSLLRREREWAGRNETLLIGQSEVDPALERL